MLTYLCQAFFNKQPVLDPFITSSESLQTKSRYCISQKTMKWIKGILEEEKGRYFLLHLRDGLEGRGFGRHCMCSPISRALTFFQLPHLSCRFALWTLTLFPIPSSFSMICIDTNFLSFVLYSLVILLYYLILPPKPGFF